MHSEIYADTMLRSVALSVARNQVGANRPMQEVLSSEGITTQQYSKIANNPMYKRYLDNYVRELQDSGFSFAAKCKVLAEDLLPIAYAMARDPDVPPATRAKMVENLVDWADLKPKSNVQVNAGGSGFSISFNFPQESQKTTVLDDEDYIDAEMADEEDTYEKLLEDASETVEIPLETLEIPVETLEIPVETVQEPIEDPKPKAFSVKPVKNDSSLLETLEDIFGAEGDYYGDDVFE